VLFQRFSIYRIVRNKAAEKAKEANHHGYQQTTLGSPPAPLHSPSNRPRTNNQTSSSVPSLTAAAGLTSTTNDEKPPPSSGDPIDRLTDVRGHHHQGHLAGYHQDPGGFCASALAAGTHMASPHDVHQSLLSASMMNRGMQLPFHPDYSLHGFPGHQNTSRREMTGGAGEDHHHHPLLASSPTGTNNNNVAGHNHHHHLHHQDAAGSPTYMNLVPTRSTTYSIHGILGISSYPPHMQAAAAGGGQNGQVLQQGTVGEGQGVGGGTMDGARARKAVGSDDGRQFNGKPGECRVQP
jgi:hypothetical protein